MSSTTQTVAQKQRITFRPTAEAAAILENVDSRKLTALINRSIIQVGATESALRAARNRIAELEKQIVRSTACPRCENQGRFMGTVTAVEHGIVKTLVIPVFCQCQAGKVALESEILTQRTRIAEGASLKLLLKEEA